MKVKCKDRKSGGRRGIACDVSVSGVCTGHISLIMFITGLFWISADFICDDHFILFAFRDFTNDKKLEQTRKIK